MQHTFFEEEAKFVARVEEVAIADVIALLASAEFGHWMVVEGEVIEHGVSFLEQSFCRVGTQGIGDEQVAICVPEVELFGSEAAAQVGGRWWRDARGHCGWESGSGESCAEGEKE